MKIKFKAVLLVVGLFSLAFFGLARAEEVNIPKAQANQQAIQNEEFITVATVNIYNAKIVEQKDNEFKLSFDLSNKELVQPGVKYMVSLTKLIEREGKEPFPLVVEEHVYSEIINLNENQTIKKEITYVAPKYLKGKFIMGIIARNQSSLPLSNIGLGEINLTGDSQYLEIIPETCYLKIKDDKEDKIYRANQGVDIKETERLVAFCEVRNNFEEAKEFTSEFNTYERTVFGDEVKTENGQQSELALNSKEKKLMYFELPQAKSPQAYDVRLKFKDKQGNILSNTVIFHYVLRGQSASIQNLRLNKDYYQKGDTAKVSFFFSLSADSFPGSRFGATEGTKLFADIEIKNKTGEVCAFTKQKELGQKTQLTELDLLMQKDCLDPKIKLTLNDASGKIFDDKDFSIASQNIPAEINKSNKSVYLVVILIVLVLLFLAMMVIRKRKGQLALILFLILAGTFFYNNKEAHANTLVLIEGGLVATIEIPDQQASYAPGENIGAQASVHLYACFNMEASLESVTISNGVGSTSWGRYDYLQYEKAGEFISERNSAIYFTSLPVQSTPGTYNVTFSFHFMLHRNSESSYEGTASGTMPYIVAISIPAIPSSISGGCTPLGAISVSWSSSAGATLYAFRFDDDSPSWNSPYAFPDIADDNYAGTSYGKSGGVPGRQYTAWVHACNTAGCSNSSSAVTFTCPVSGFSCQGAIPSKVAHTEPHDLEESQSLVDNSTFWTYSASDTGTKCQYRCEVGYTWDGSNCKAPSCSITFNQASIPYHGTETFSWSSSGATSLVYTCTGPFDASGSSSGSISPMNGTGSHDYTGINRSGIEFCSMTPSNSGVIGSACSGSYTVQPAVLFSCTGSVPANATLCANDNTGLPADTPRTLISSCGAPKCEYYCNSGYSLSGGVCVPSSVVNGSCGPAAQVYAYDAVAYAGAYCSVGSASSTPAFPAQGASVSWNCVGSGGGSTAFGCTASRNLPPSGGNAPTATIIQPISTQTINTGASVNFLGTGSDPDSDPIIAYEWRLNDCNFGNLWSGAQTFTPTFNVAGTYDIYFRVQDSTGLWSTNCPTRRIIVNPAGGNTITAVPASITVNDSTTITWNAPSSPNGRVGFRLNGGPLNTPFWGAMNAGSSVQSLGTAGTWTFILFSDLAYSNQLASVNVTVNPAGCIPSCTAWSACVAGNQTRSCTRADCSIDIETQVCCLPSHVCVSPACAGLCGVQNDYCQPICGGDCTGVICSGTVTCPPCNSGNWQEIAP